MKLTEIMEKQEADRDPDEILVELTLNVLNRSSLQIALEGQWMQSGDKDWMYRVDPAIPSIPLKRHVHIAKSKHVASKSMQASWNDDGTRHDKGSFNTTVGSTARVREIARNVLQLSQDITLESAGASVPTVALVEEVRFSED